MTTPILSGGTPRAIDSWRSGSWTVISSSATAAEARVTPETSGISGRRRGARNRSRKNSGMSSWRSSSSGTPAELLGQRRESEEVGHGRDLDEVVSPLAMLPSQPPGGHGGEGGVLGQVAGEAGEEPVQREADDALGAIGLVGRLAGLAEGEDVDLVPGIGQGVALAAHAWVAGVDGVDDDGDRRGSACP